MSNITNITFNDDGGKGTLTVYKNNLEKGKRYYGRFDRRTITMEQIIARIQKKNLGTNALMVQHITTLLKAEILEALSRGEAVNIMDLGTLFISAYATSDSENADEISVENLTASFTPSATAKEALKNISVNKISVADNRTSIDSLVDTYTDEDSTAFSCGSLVRIKGSRIKLGGEDNALFLCPVKEESDAERISEENEWTKIDENLIKKNLLNRIDFYIPKSQKGGKYKVLIRTKYSGGSKSSKSVREAMSATIDITE